MGTDIDLLGNGGASGFADVGATAQGDSSAVKSDGGATKEFPEEFGWSCTGTGQCASGLQCFGNIEYPSAICTTACGSDADCPGEFACTKVGNDSACLRREFCSACSSDAQCGPQGRCIQMGKGSYCSRECDPKHTDCPRFAACKSVSEGGYACVHAAGDCQGDGTLCAACAAEESCGPGGSCLTYQHTKEQFCSAPCNGSTCPANFKCVDIKTPTGASKQCVPADTKAPKCVDKLHGMLEAGDTMQDFTVTGYVTNGDGVTDEPMAIKLSEFAKNGYKIILFNAAAGWCQPCQQETTAFKSLAAKYPDLGIYQVLFDNIQPGQVPTLKFLNSWVKLLKPAGVIGIDPERNVMPINTEGSTPLNMIIDAKTMKILKKFNGAPGNGFAAELYPYFQ